MSYSTLYFDLRDESTFNKISKSSIDKLLLSETTSSATGSTSPFYIIFKMNGLFLKRKPNFWQLLNKFQETAYPFQFVTVFVDKSPRDGRPVIHLSQELQKQNVRMLWIPDPRGLEIDGQSIPLSIARWDEDPDGEMALDEFIEIIKIPEVFQDLIKRTSDQKVYIPGYKKLKVGFGNEKDNFDVFFKAINSITGNLNPSDIPAIIFNKPSETIIGSDLIGSDFIEDTGLLSENVKEILNNQRRLLYLFGIIKDKNSSSYQNMVKRAELSLNEYQQEITDIEKFISLKIDELAEKLSSVDALSGLSNEEINSLLEIGINITAKSSEFDEQQDIISENIWNDLIKNLKNGYSFEALLPNLENEIVALTPKDKNKISEKVKEVKKAKIFSNLNMLEKLMPKFLSTLLGGVWTNLLLVKNYILAFFVIVSLIFASIQVNSSRALCEEALGVELTQYSNIKFVQDFILNTDPNDTAAKKCKEALPIASSDFYFDYDALLEVKDKLAQAKILYSDGDITVQEYSEIVDEHNQIVRNYNNKIRNVNRLLYILLALFIPLLIYVVLTLLSVLLLFYTNVLIRSWGNNLGIKQFEVVSKNLKNNIEEIVLNDIKFGHLRYNLSNQLSIYKNLINDLQEYVNSSEESFMNLQVDALNKDKNSLGVVNPKYVNKVTPISQGQSRGMFDRVVKISRNEIITILVNSSQNNLSKLFGRNPESFKESVSKEFQTGLSQYISSIKARGILEIEDLNNSESNREKEDLRAEIWKNDSIIKQPLEEIIQSNKNDLTMQMIGSNDIDLLDKQNTEWRFLKFLPKTTVDWFKVLFNSSGDGDYTLTEYSETAGYIRLIPINRNSMDIVQ